MQLTKRHFPAWNLEAFVFLLVLRLVFGVGRAGSGGDTQKSGGASTPRWSRTFFRLEFDQIGRRSPLGVPCWNRCPSFSQKTREACFDTIPDQVGRKLCQSKYPSCDKSRECNFPGIASRVFQLKSLGLRVRALARQARPSDDGGHDGLDADPTIRRGAVCIANFSRIAQAIPWRH